MSLARLTRLNTSSAEWKPLLEDLRNKIVSSSPDVVKLYVFGSFTHHRMTDESDLDIAIILKDGVNTLDFRKCLPTPLSSWPLDLVLIEESRFNKRKNYGGILFDIYHEGIELYPNWELT